MDVMTRDLLNRFVDALQKEIHSRKEYHFAQLGTWSLNDNKVKLEVFILPNEDKEHIYFDLREVKENPDFSHLFGNLIDQLMQFKK